MAHAACNDCGCAFAECECGEDEMSAIFFVGETVRTVYGPTTAVVQNIDGDFVGIRFADDTVRTLNRNEIVTINKEMK